MTIAKSTKLATFLLLTLAASSSVMAETYEGVHQSTSVKSRADVEAEAIQAAAAANQNIPRGSRVAEATAASTDRALVEKEAIRYTSRPDQNVGTGSKFNSTVISTLPHPLDKQASAK